MVNRTKVASVEVPRDPDALLTNIQQQALLGNASPVTLWRRQQEPDYPRAIVIGGRPFRRRRDVIAYIEHRAQTPITNAGGEVDAT